MQYLALGQRGGGRAASEKNLVKGKENWATDEILCNKMQAEKKE